MQSSKRICSLFIKRVTAKRINAKLPFLTPTLLPESLRLQSKALSSSSSLSFNKSVETLIAARFYHDDSYLETEDDVDNLYQDHPKAIKHILYPSHDDPLLPMLNASASIQEVFDFIKKYDKILQPMHLAQSVLVLWDLQRMFLHVTEMRSIDKVETLMREYKNSLLTRPEFGTLLECIEQATDKFDDEVLSCIILYLNKIGLNINHSCMKKMFYRLQKLTNENSSLSTISRFLVSAKTNFNESAFGQYQHLIPIIYKRLDECTNVEDLTRLSICFNIMNETVSTEQLQKYLNKVQNLLADKVLTANDTESLIKVILFLNYPQWRCKHQEFLSKCMLLLKPKISQMSLNELLILNEVYLKSQEPADISFELQRATAKFLLELEETQHPLYLKRLRLVNALIRLSSPKQRPDSETMIRKYFHYPLDGKCLLELLKGIQYTKVMDPLLCKSFWDKILTEMEHDEAFKNDYLVKVCFAYLIYIQNLSYRHLKLEKRLNQWIEGLIATSVLPFNAYRFMAIAAFVIAFGNDVAIMNYVTIMFRKRIDLFQPLNCIYIARSLHLGKTITKNVHLKERYYNSLCQTIDQITVRELTDEKNIDVNVTNLLLKTYIYSNQVEHDNVNRLLLTYKADTYLSSKQIKNLTICLLTTSAFLPEIIDMMVDYVCRCKKNILAFNAEKVAFLCYYIGYVPKKYDLFAKVLVDLIIRDQEKINGLSYLQCCLSLCFFNKMTGPLIKQIFNVQFMEKLDSELRNCYAKDVYPNRVRNRLMEVNRTVCIDFPELNIPWFHQKFVEKYRNDSADPLFQANVQNYLHKILYDCDIESNTFTPYGYNIDFTVNYKDDDNNLLKLAILLLKPKSYTTINSQLKGSVQTKMRHLEMFGYKVKILPSNEWNDLVYGEDKLTYIKNLLNLPNRYPNFYYQNQINR